MAKLTKRARAVLLEHIRRRADHGLNFKPNEVQDAYLRSQAHYRVIHGANQVGGKTYVACQEARMLLTCTHPYRSCPQGANILFLPPSRGQAVDPLGKYLLEGDPNSTIYHNRYPMLPVDQCDIGFDRHHSPPAPRWIKHQETQCVIWFFWAAFSRAKAFLQGKQFLQVYVDESAGNKELMNELYPRVGAAREEADRKGQIGGGISWMNTEDTENLAFEEFLAKCKDPAQKDYEAFLITDDIFDRGSVYSRSTWESVYAGVSDEERAIRLDGTASRGASKRIYPILTAERAKYVLDEPYQPGEDDNILVVMDPGMGHNGGLAVGFVGRDCPRQIHWKQCWMAHSKSLSWWTSLLIDYLDGRKMARFVPDHYYWNRKDWGTLKSIQRQLREYLDDPDMWSEGAPSFKTVDQHVEIGISRVHSYLDPGPESSPYPLITWDPPTPHNGMAEFYHQCASYRGSSDPDHPGILRPIKKSDEGPDMVRYACMLGWSWKDFGPNLPSGMYDPESQVDDYERVTQRRLEDLERRKRSARAAQRILDRKKAAKRRRRR